MKKFQAVTPDTVGTPYKKYSENSSTQRYHLDDLSVDASYIDISDSQSLPDFSLDFGLGTSNRVLIPKSELEEDIFESQVAKIRDLIYQEIRTSSYVPKKNKFFHDLKFLFLRDSFLSYSKTQINRLGKQLAKSLNINTIKSEVKWVQDFTYSENLFYTGFLINSSREGFGRVSFKKLHQQGGVKYEGVFINNGCHGEVVKIYYESGKIMFEGKMVEGVREGFGRLYWDNGKIAFSGFWKNNNPHGKMIEIRDKHGLRIYAGKCKNVCVDAYFKNTKK